MAVVIADTSPLQYLFQIGVLDLLPGLFGEVLVPEAVRDELQVGRSLGFHVPDLAATRCARPYTAGWSSVRASAPSIWSATSSASGSGPVWSSAWSSGATAERTVLPRGEVVDGLAAHDLLDILDGTDVHGDGP